MLDAQETRNQRWVDEIGNLIKARCPLVAVTSLEEARIVEELAALCEQLDHDIRLWSRTRGFTFMSGEVDSATRDPIATLEHIAKDNQSCVYVLADFHPYLKEPTVVRLLRELNRDLKTSHKTIVLISPLPWETAELAREWMRVEVPLPDTEVTKQVVSRAIQSVSQTLPDFDMEELVRASLGLTQNEIENALARCLVSDGKINIRSMLNEKQAIVKKSGIMDFIELSGDLGEVGGLDRLKHWLSTRRSGFSEAAKERNLPSPKGILLVGIPGCGKSLTARATASTWNLPLIRLDVGRVFAGVVGASENNMRLALNTAEAVAPCILWIDEVEKAFASTRSQSQGDSGTSMRVFGTLLTWMQEKEKPVFVVATANNVRQLPPEFLRKGRFDELFFVDLPSDEERLDILNIQLERYGWKFDGLDTAKFLEASRGFSGAEIEQALISSCYSSFFHKRELQAGDLYEALDNTRPLSATHG